MNDDITRDHILAVLRHHHIPRPNVVTDDILNWPPTQRASAEGSAPPADGDAGGAASPGVPTPHDTDLAHTIVDFYQQRGTHITWRFALSFATLIDAVTTALITDRGDTPWD